MIVVLYILLLLIEHHGQVMFAGFPVPGATVTAEQGDKKFIAITDQKGVYSFPEVAEGGNVGILHNQPRSECGGG